MSIISINFVTVLMLEIAFISVFALAMFSLNAAYSLILTTYRAPERMKQKPSASMSNVEKLAVALRVMDRCEFFISPADVLYVHGKLSHVSMTTSQGYGNNKDLAKAFDSFTVIDLFNNSYKASVAIYNNKMVVSGHPNNMIDFVRNLKVSVSDTISANIINKDLWFRFSSNSIS